MGIGRKREIRVLGMPGPCEHGEAANQGICSGVCGASASGGSRTEACRGTRKPSVLIGGVSDVAGSEAGKVIAIRIIRIGKMCG